MSTDFLGYLEVFDWASGKRLCRITWEYDESVSFPLFTADGRHLLFQRKGRAPLLAFDAGTGKEANAYPQLADVPSLHYLAGGRGGVVRKSLLCCSGRNLRVYDVASGKEIGSFDGGVNPKGV